MSEQVDLLEAFATENGINYTQTHTTQSGAPPASGAVPAEIYTLPLPRTLPSIRRLSEYIKNPPQKPPELIKGVLHEGSKFVLGGGSKSFKTWSLIDLGISVALGEPWWSWQTVKKRVLYLNFEVQDSFFWNRIEMICAARGISLPADTFDIWPLRGHAADINDLIPKILERVVNEKYGLIVVDPVYKLMGGRDENSAGDIGSMMNALEQLAVQTGAAVVFGAHYAKGNAAKKDRIDRISGSGVFARDPDTILGLTHHENEDCFTVDLILRNFPPVTPFVVEWAPPLLVRKIGLDPKKLKQTTGSPKQYNPDDLLPYLTEARLNKDWMEETIKETGMSEKTFFNLKKELTNQEIVIQDSKTKTWTRNKMPDGTIIPTINKPD